ncbi:MAG TPA: LacI family DNA-binding transcriptional regulator [Paenibacillus sp.]|nr:LacI family DNA-binding transcriptional regulator [Paenibacillus sp.]
MKRKKTVTLQDLAQELRLSAHTVSKALRGLPGMSEATRRDVFEAARRLGYHTKEQDVSAWFERVPRLLSNGKRFALLLAEDSPFFRLQLTGLQERLNELGHSVAVTFLPPSVANLRGLSQWVEHAQLTYYDGLFLPPAIPDWIEKALLELPLPKVMINFPPPLAKIDSVIWDVDHAVRQAVDAFASKGHKRILYVGELERHRGFQIRWTAFQQAMRAIGMDAEPSGHMIAPYAAREPWETELDEKLRASGATAILCGIELYMHPLLFYLQARGKRVPADYSLISLETTSSTLLPDVTRPSLLLRESGRRAAERLLWRIANPGEPYEHIRLAGGFIAGSTVARLDTQL